MLAMTTIVVLGKGKAMSDAVKYCTDCKYEYKSEEEHPCCICSNSYINKWAPKSKGKEFREEDLIEAFRNEFLERRAIGLIEIEKLIERLFEE